MNQPIDSVDPALGLLVDTINKADPEKGPGVVLSVGGTTISGFMISNRRWFAENSDLMASARLSESPGSTDKSAWELFFDDWQSTVTDWEKEEIAALEYFDKMPDSYKSALLEVRKVGYIHLRNAVVVTSGKPPLPAHGMLWRGQLAAVDGWVFGTIGTPSTS